MFRRKIEVPRWTEAEPQRGWPQRGGTTWPTDAEYVFLRLAKNALDTGNYIEAPACPCDYCRSTKEAGWVCFAVVSPVINETGPGGAQKVSAVRRARNKYGYESGIFLNCEGVRSKDFLMRWDGVPLKVEIAEDRREPEIVGGDAYRQRIIAGGATVRVSRGVGDIFRRG